MTSRPPYPLVHTDLDATLLNHDTYSWQPALPALTRLQELGIPLILNSSKTLAEMQELATELNLSHPLVCENGSLIAIPRNGDFSLSEIETYFPSIEVTKSYWLGNLGRSRGQFIETLHKLRESNPEYRFEGYSDWSAEDVAKHTGLPIEQAHLSHPRQGTEPIHWHGRDEAYKRFLGELAQYEIQAVAGGRFIHISGLSDKAHGLRKLNELYQLKHPQRELLTIALGDSPNDLNMLNAADIAVVIPNKEKLQPSAKKVIYAQEPGPTGWNTEMLALLEQV